MEYDYQALEAKKREIRTLIRGAMPYIGVKPGQYCRVVDIRVRRTDVAHETGNDHRDDHRPTVRFGRRTVTKAGQHLLELAKTDGSRT